VERVGVIGSGAFGTAMACVVRPRVFETTALGAAYLAGLAVGYWKNRKDIAAQWRAERRFEPKMSRDEAQQLQARWRKALGRAKGWARS